MLPSSPTLVWERMKFFVSEGSGPETEDLWFPEGTNPRSLLPGELLPQPPRDEVVPTTKSSLPKEISGGWRDSRLCREQKYLRVSSVARFRLLLRVHSTSKPL